MLTFYDLQQEVLRYIDEAEDTDTTRALVKDALNRSHRKLLTARTWPFLRWPREVSFSTVVGRRAYALKAGVGKVLALYDDQLSELVPFVDRREWEMLGVDRVGGQNVPVGVQYGPLWPVAVQPSNEVVTATSSTDSDASATIILTGIDTNGNAATETLTLADVGATAAATSTTVWSDLTAVTKGSAFTGTLTLSASTAGTLLTLGASDYGKQHLTIEFVETPSEVRDYRYTAQVEPRILVNDYDIPQTPYPFSELHVWDALLDLTGYNTELGGKEQQLWDARYKELHNGLLSAYDEQLAGSQPRFVRNMNPRLISRIHTAGV